MIEIDTDTNTQIIPAPVESEKMTLAVVDFEEQATGLVVKSAADLTIASSLLSGIKALIAEAEAEYRPNINRWHQGHKEALASLKKINGPLVALEKLVKGTVADYLDEQERIRKEAEQKAAAEAKRIEDERLNREADAAAAESKRIADEEAALAAAIEADEAGDDERAAEILESIPEPQPEPEPFVLAAPTVEIPKAPPRVQGMSSSKKYTATVEDLTAFARWAFTVGRPNEFFTVNQSALNKAAEKAKDDFDIPGCKLHTETVVASRKV